MPISKEEMAALREDDDRREPARIVARSAAPPQERAARGEIERLRGIMENGADASEVLQKAREREDIDREVERLRDAYLESKRAKMAAWTAYDEACRRRDNPPA